MLNIGQISNRKSVKEGELESGIPQARGMLNITPQNVQNPRNVKQNFYVKPQRA